MPVFERKTKDYLANYTFKVGEYMKIEMIGPPFLNLHVTFCIYKVFIL